MKKVLLALAAFVLLMAPVAYADPVGDVTAPCGKAAFSVGYFYENQKLDVKDWDDTAKFTSHQVYVEGAFGFAKGWDAFLRFGGATAKGSEEYFDADFKDDFTPYGSIGVRGYLPITKDISVGPFAKFNYYGNWDNKIYGLDVKVKDTYDFMGGVLGKITIQKVAVYGGPFYYYIHSKVDVDYLGDSKVEGKQDFGGLLGVKVPVAANLSVNAEGQYKNDRLSAGLFATYQF
jgi:hypothetical protein